MNKCILSLFALGVLVSSGPAFAQKAEKPAVVIPPGVFIEQQADDQYLARDVMLFAKVRDTKGKIIGDIEDLIMTSDNQLVGVVMGTGGFLGAGEKRVAVRLSALEITEKDGKVSVVLPEATKEILGALPAFKRNQPPKSMLQRIKEKAQELTDKTVETSKEAAHTASEKAGPAMEKAKEAAEKAYEKAKDAAGNVIDKAKDAAAPAEKQ
ncbi:MAG: PRC-barrel domain-containing protein [Hyphomicrobiaceae bacterium]